MATQDKKCQLITHDIYMLDDKYLTADINRTAEKDYIDNFILQIISKVCCYDCKLPHLVLRLSNGDLLTFTAPYKNHVTLADMREQLNICKQSMLEHKNCPK